ncbi:MAG: hypothetical protein Q8R92_06270 [Deltaproteobacteria bacterium]|nr:hypothetical protein [Deltaproteobacteria bacterium]
MRKLDFDECAGLVLAALAITAKAPVGRAKPGQQTVESQKEFRQPPQAALRCADGKFGKHDVASFVVCRRIGRRVLGQNHFQERDEEKASADNQRDDHCRDDGGGKRSAKKRNHPRDRIIVKHRCCP